MIQAHAGNAGREFDWSQNIHKNPKDMTEDELKAYVKAINRLIRELPNGEARADAMEGICSCGAIDELWCCYDPPRDRD